MTANENDANLMFPGRAFVPVGSKVESVTQGGSGSGNFGHGGRPGERGGSGEGAGGNAHITRLKESTKVSMDKGRASKASSENMNVDFGRMSALNEVEKEMPAGKEKEYLKGKIASETKAYQEYMASPEKNDDNASLHAGRLSALHELNKEYEPKAAEKEKVMRSVAPGRYEEVEVKAGLSEAQLKERGLERWDKGSPETKSAGKDTGKSLTEIHHEGQQKMYEDNAKRLNDLAKSEKDPKKAAVYLDKAKLNEKAATDSFYKSQEGKSQFPPSDNSSERTIGEMQDREADRDWNTRSIDTQRAEQDRKEDRSRVKWD